MRGGQLLDFVGGHIAHGGLPQFPPPRTRKNPGVAFSFVEILASVHLFSSTPTEPFDMTNTARAVYDFNKFMLIKDEFKRVSAIFFHFYSTVRELYPKK